MSNLSYRSMLVLNLLQLSSLVRLVLELLVDDLMNQLMQARMLDGVGA